MPLVVIEIDGSRHSGSGTIVRLAVALSALTGRSLHIVNVRARRPKSGLRLQHVKVVEAIGQLSGGTAEGVQPGSSELIFRPGRAEELQHYVWDIGSAGSTTLLALAVLPVLAFRRNPVTVELHGGIFQDFAPSFYHFNHVLLPLLRRMGINATARMERPGYVPRGDGVLHLEVTPSEGCLSPLHLNRPAAAQRVWGIALASHLRERKVSHRMAESAQRVLSAAGHAAEIEPRDDTTALQPGAALAVFADLEGNTRLGADRAGAPRRSAESIGKQVARQLLEDLRSRAPLDRWAADQLVLFSALAGGVSDLRVPRVSTHILSNAWLVKEFLGANVTVGEQELSITGAGFRRNR